MGGSESGRREQLFFDSVEAYEVTTETLFLGRQDTLPGPRANGRSEASELSGWDGMGWALGWTGSGERRVT